MKVDAHKHPPVAFISYSWDSEQHRTWVKDLAARLRNNGIDAKIDKWEVAPGDPLPEFMEQRVRESNYVLIVCTPIYKQKSEERKGGVGYESTIITAEVFTKSNHRKFIPILRSGTRQSAIPSWLTGKSDIDLSDNPYSEEQFDELVATMLDRREKAPPIVQPLTATPRQKITDIKPVEKSQFSPVEIIQVLEDEVGTPRNDGTPGSALYSIPIKLNQSPPLVWRHFFVQAWNHPEEYTTMHQPGIAQVQGDRIILDRTTVEFLRDTHTKTLRMAVEKANSEYFALTRKHWLKDQQQQALIEDNKGHVKSAISNIKFK